MISPASEPTFEGAFESGPLTQTLDVLAAAKKIRPDVLTKSSLMLGLGESDDEILQSLKDLRQHQVDVVTLGQYLRPTPEHASVERYWSPEEFDELAHEARARGFLLVSASPLTRSSYHAQQDFLNFVLKQYVDSGVDELDDAKLPQLLELKYEAIADAKAKLGDTKSIRETFIGFQEHLYEDRVG